jgi:hypothetical protein
MNARPLSKLQPISTDGSCERPVGGMTAAVAHEPFASRLVLRRW